MKLSVLPLLELFLVIVLFDSSRIFNAAHNIINTRIADHHFAASAKTTKTNKIDFLENRFGIEEDIRSQINEQDGTSILRALDGRFE